MNDFWLNHSISLFHDGPKRNKLVIKVEQLHNLHNLLLAWNKAIITKHLFQKFTRHYRQDSSIHTSEYTRTMRTYFGNKSNWNYALHFSLKFHKLVHKIRTISEWVTWTILPLVQSIATNTIHSTKTGHRESR